MEDRMKYKPQRRDASQTSQQPEMLFCIRRDVQAGRRLDQRRFAAVDQALTVLCYLGYGVTERRAVSVSKGGTKRAGRNESLCPYPLTPDQV